MVHTKVQLTPFFSTGSFHHRTRHMIAMFRQKRKTVICIREKSYKLNHPENEPSGVEIAALVAAS